MPTETTAAPSAVADRLWTVDDVATYCGLSKSWVSHAAADGRIPAACVIRIPFARALRFDPEKIKAWARGEVPSTVADVVPLRKADS